MKKQLLTLFIIVLLSILAYMAIMYVYNVSESVNTDQVITVPPSEDFDNTIGGRQ